MADRGQFSFDDESTGTGTGASADDHGGSGGGASDSGGGGVSGGGGSGGGDGGALDPRTLAGDGGGAGGASEPGGERDSAGVRWDPARHSSSRAKTADGRWRVRRGLGGSSAARPSQARRTAKDTLAVGEVRQFLAAIHVMAATVTRTPELELDGEEAQNLAVPLTEIANLYDIPVTREMRLYSMLAIACLMVYGPKVHAIRQRTKAERAHKVGQGRAQPRPSAPGANGGPPPAPAPFGPVIDPAGAFSAAAPGGPVVADPNGPIILNKLN